MGCFCGFLLDLQKNMSTIYKESRMLYCDTERLGQLEDIEMASFTVHILLTVYKEENYEGSQHAEIKFT
jgi:hypothetical protein